MNILSWDIGIKNLAYIFIKGDDKKCIYEWNLINLIHNKPTCYIKKCKLPVKQYCSFYKKKIFCCVKHNNIYTIIKTKFGTSNLTTLKSYKYKYLTNIYILKQILVRYLDTYIFPLINLYNINYILIENQPCLKNPTMKSIADTIYTWSLIRCCIDTTICEKIYYISAKNKLKNIPNIVSYYNKKCKGIELVSEYLKKNNINLLKYLNTFKKKDDLCDALLQALYWIDNFNIH